MSVNALSNERRRLFSRKFGKCSSLPGGLHPSVYFCFPLPMMYYTIQYVALVSAAFIEMSLRYARCVAHLTLMYTHERSRFSSIEVRGVEDALIGDR